MLILLPFHLPRNLLIQRNKSIDVTKINIDGVPAALQTVPI